jgi:hypothetical protein
MTLENTLLAKLTEWHPPPGRQALSVSDPASGWTATVTTDRHDAVGSLVWELSVRGKAPAAGLKAWAERVVARAVGLVEPLAVLEIDAGRNEALLRSDTPAERGDSLFYYELLLRGAGEAVLRRYRADRQPGQRREQVAFALTHEAIANLVGRLTAAG